MPTRVNVPVNVNVNVAGVTYSNGQWTGSPVWTVPAKTPVSPGLNDITWSIQANPPNRFNAAFASTDGVYFPLSSNWGGGTPTLQPNGTIVATDDFSAPPAAIDYYYGLNVTLTDPTSGANKTFNFDPEVENEAGTLSHTPMSAIAGV
jgi:hypothetical protein